MTLDEASTMRTSRAEAPEGAGAVDRCLRLLDEVSLRPGTSTELARRLATPRSTVIRLLRVLESHAYVVQDGGGVYRGGPKPLELAARWREQTSLPRFVTPYLEELVARFEETAYVCVRRGLESLCVAGLESPRSVRFSLDIGARTALHAGGFNKTLLAFSSQEIADAVLERPLAAFTERTITEAARLRRELSRIRANGFGESVGEMDEGVFACAAPIRDADGDLVGVIGVGGPVGRMSTEQLAEIRSEVVRVARKVSAALGFVADPLAMEVHEGRAP